MKELYFFDETFYWGRSGKRATVIEAECELTQSVRPDELRAAVVSALRVHRNFRARPVIVGRRFYVEDSEAEQVAVISEADGLPRRLGTKETGGLMLYVSYGERRFTLHVFHGLGGKAECCDAIARQVQTVGVSAGSYSYPLWIIACEYKGILRMRLVQSFESDRLANVIYEELAALFPGTAYTDRGHHDFDSFPLGSVPRKDNKQV